MPWSVAFVNSQIVTPTVDTHFAGNNLTATGNRTHTFGANTVEITYNTLGGASAFKLSSTSTAAASNLQKMLEISLSGVNANSNQITYGAYIVNSHTGTGATGYGVLAEGTTFGVQATSVAGIALSASSSNQPGLFTLNHASSSGIFTVVELRRTNSGGGGANDIGGALDFVLEASSSSAQSARIASTWTDATVGTRTGDLQFWTTNSASSTLKMTISGNGNVGIGAVASAAALLELTSTTKAFIVMRMTSAQAGAITAANGMMLYVTDTDATFTAVGFWGREAGAWVKL